MKKNDYIVLAISAISITALIFIIRIVPDQIPLHWNAKGEIDRTGSKYTLWFLSFLPIILWILFKVIPLIDPKKESYKRHSKPYEIFKFLMIVVLVALLWIVVLYSIGFMLNIQVIATMIVGIVFIVTGNFMGQIRQNFTFGIKTPWTLASKNVWQKTHRLGGWTMLLGGILLIISGFTKIPILYILFGTAILLQFVPMFYSLYLYRKEKRDNLINQ